VCKKRAWSMFCGILELSDLDKVQTIKELFCVKFGLISLPLFDVAEVDFTKESTWCLFLLTFYLYVFVRFYNNYIVFKFSRILYLGNAGSRVMWQHERRDVR